MYIMGLVLWDIHHRIYNIREPSITSTTSTACFVKLTDPKIIEFICFERGNHGILPTHMLIL